MGGSWIWPRAGNVGVVGRQETEDRHDGYCRSRSCGKRGDVAGRTGDWFGCGATGRGPELEARKRDRGDVVRSFLASPGDGWSTTGRRPSAAGVQASACL